MAENKKSISYYFDIIYNVNYGFNERYGTIFISPEQFERVSSALSSLRRGKYISGETYHTVLDIFKIHAIKYYQLKDKISREPRIDAQKFIRKKNVRNFIFKRDRYKCLRCGKDENLSLDHIVPIHLGGENKLSNLQTLCKSCNSWKSTKIIDYRKGSRYE